LRMGVVINNCLQTLRFREGRLRFPVFPVSSWRTKALEEAILAH
jgi:hypothetical protein